MFKQIKLNSRVIKKEMRQYVTYLKNGLDFNVIIFYDSFIFMSYECKIKQVQHEH